MQAFYFSRTHNRSKENSKRMKNWGSNNHTIPHASYTENPWRTWVKFTFVTWKTDRKVTRYILLFRLQFFLFTADHKIEVGKIEGEVHFLQTRREKNFISFESQRFPIEIITVNMHENTLRLHVLNDHMEIIHKLPAW